MPSLESKHPLLITAAKVTIKLEATKKFLLFFRNRNYNWNRNSTESTIKNGLFSLTKTIIEILQLPQSHAQSSQFLQVCQGISLST